MTHSKLNVYGSNTATVPSQIFKMAAKNQRWPPKNMENQKYLPNYKSFWYAQRTKVVYQVKLHKHAKFENHTLKNSRVTPLQKTRKMVKFMFFSNNFLTTKKFIIIKEFYLLFSSFKTKYWFLREWREFLKIQDDGKNIQNINIFDIHEEEKWFFKKTYSFLKNSSIWDKY